ncbi:MAG: ABC transporter ATP-binding protein, partial [Kofleriaceae bacterium]
WGRAVEVARKGLDRAEAAIPDGPQQKDLGRSIFVGFDRAPRRWLFELAAPVIRAGDHPVLHDVRVAVGNADRIRIAGPNGAGKTTLLAALLATGPRDRVLVLPQELDADAGPRLVGELRAARPDLRGRTLQLVAALGADPDRLLASAAPSPGEARKLQLALGLARHAWAVVLDEPTNHFDLPSIERLEDALAADPGALVLVTHDDRFAERLTTRTWRLERGKVGVE